MINGELVTLNQQSLSFRPFEGGELGGTYEGEKFAVFALAASLTASGYSVSYDFVQSRIAKLTFRSAFQSINGGAATNPNVDYMDTWELVRSSTHKELLESDHPLVSVLIKGDMDALKEAFANPSKFIIPIFASAAGTASQDAGFYLWELFRSGAKTVEVKQPILRLTRTTNVLYSAPFYTGNIDKVLTTASMKYDSGVPGGFAIPLVDLANALISRSGNLTAQARADGLLFSFGWLKELVGCHKHGNQRIQYVLEYKFGLWDTKLYGVPS